MENEPSTETVEKDPSYLNWHELIVPDRVELDQESHSDSFAKFVVQPLERGFATTISNSLRRILMSSVQGAAITAVKIEGAKHELSTIPGVLEDVTEIILNLKEVRLKLHGLESQTIRIEKKSVGPVLAREIQCGELVEIMNGEKQICTISENAGRFCAEFVVEWGKGYSPAEKHKAAEQNIGTIPIDAIFTPIKKVTSVVSQARVGQQTDYDKLTMEIHTDGSVKPQDALAFAAKILKQQMQVFINFDEDAVEPEPELLEEKQAAPVNDNLYRSVEDLELSVRSANCLRNANIRHIGELVQRSEAEMLKTKNFGRKSLNEIKQLLSEMDLSLGIKVDNWEPPSEGGSSSEATE